MRQASPPRIRSTRGRTHRPDRRRRRRLRPERARRRPDARSGGLPGHRARGGGRDRRRDEILGPAHRPRRAPRHLQRHPPVRGRLGGVPRDAARAPRPAVGPPRRRHRPPPRRRRGRGQVPRPRSDRRRARRGRARVGPAAPADRADLRRRRIGHARTDRPDPAPSHRDRTRRAAVAPARDRDGQGVPHRARQGAVRRHRRARDPAAAPATHHLGRVAHGRGRPPLRLAGRRRWIAGDRRRDGQLPARARRRDPHRRPGHLAPRPAPHAGRAARRRSPCARRDRRRRDARTGPGTQRPVALRPGLRSRSTTPSEVGSRGPPSPPAAPAPSTSSAGSTS